MLSRAAVNRRAKTFSRVNLRGPKSPPESLSFRKQARALASWAKEWASLKKDGIVAIYFRDTDDRRSTPATAWREKWNAALQGFADEGFTYGAPMLPRPKSEAWFICALKANPYEQCGALEERSGSSKAKLPLKAELDSILGADATRVVLCECVRSGKVVAARIDMPSFVAFRERLEAVLRATLSDRR